jgi:hypothetical protein
VEINGVILDKVLFLIFIFYNIKMSNLELNPCSACMKKYDIKDINSINQCCYDTAAAFAGVSSVNAIRNNQNCAQCLENSKAALGKSDCDLRLTAAAIWSQVPHYFPELLQETKDANIAKEKCLEICAKNRYYPNECSDNCQTDFNAVETYKKIQPSKKLKALEDQPQTPTPTYRSTTYVPIKKRKHEKLDKIQFYASFILSSLIFASLVIIFIQVIFNKN